MVYYWILLYIFVCFCRLLFSLNYCKLLEIIVSTSFVCVIILLYILVSYCILVYSCVFCEDNAGIMGLKEIHLL